MLHAANLVLDGKQYFAVIRIHNILESILMLIALLDNQALRSQPAMGTREIINVDLNMMLIVGLNLPVSFPEKKILSSPGGDTGKAALRVFQRGCLRAENLRVKTRDSVSCSNWHIELDVGDTNRHRPEALIWSKATDPVAPPTKRLDESVTFMAFESRGG